MRPREFSTASIMTNQEAEKDRSNGFLSGVYSESWEQSQGIRGLTGNLDDLGIYAIRCDGDE